MTCDEISVKTSKKFDWLKSMLLCAMLGVGITRESSRYLLHGLPVESDGTIWISLWRLKLLLWYLVVEMIGAAWCGLLGTMILGDRLDGNAILGLSLLEEWWSVWELCLAVVVVGWGMPICCDDAPLQSTNWCCITHLSHTSCCHLVCWNWCLLH